jgi:phage shock protein A
MAELKQHRSALRRQLAATETEIVDLEQLIEVAPLLETGQKAS